MIRFALAEDTIDKKDMDQLIAWLSGYPRLTKGQRTVAFEQQWGQWLGKRHSVFCNSGSSANLLMFAALAHSGKAKNNKVIVPSVGWVTSIAPAMQLGFEPIMCEADPDTFGLDLPCLERLLKEHRPGAVMMVQVLGVPNKMDRILALKAQYGFLLLEDACAAIGASTGGKKVGSFGDMSSFSFYFGHQMSTIEGGMVSTDDAELRDLLLMLRSHGWSKDLPQASHDRLVRRHGVDDFHTPFVFYLPGYNLRSTDLNAVLGLGQLKKLEWIIARRHENHTLYQKLLGDKFLIQRCADPQARLCSISFGAVAEGPEQRRGVVRALVENGIETRIFSAGNLGLHPFWAERYGKTSFPFADRIHHGGFFLPNNPSLKTKDVEFISQVVLEALCAQKS